MTHNEQQQRLSSLSIAFHIILVDFTLRNNMTLSEAIKILATEIDHYVTAELRIHCEMGLDSGLTRNELEQLTLPLVPQ